MAAAELITWLVDLEKDFFNDAGLADFKQLWNLEDNSSGLEIEPIRQHLQRGGSRILRQTTRIRLNNSDYFLKRSCRKAYPNIVNEFEAMQLIKEFGLTPPRLLAYAFNEEEKQGLLLFKNLAGFDSLKELLEYEAPPEVVADFQVRKKEFLKQLTRIVRRIHDADYYYPDWFGKHIYVRRASDEIALIDLERFRHLKKCPWYYCLPITRMLARRREWNTLKKTLGSSLYTPAYLKSLLHE